MTPLQNKLCYVLSCCTALNRTTFFSSPHHLFCSLLLLRFSTAKTQNPSPKPPFMAEYLKSFGFLPDEAKKASDRLTHIKSPSNPDAALHFLRQSGFSDTHIRNMISKRPRFLCANVENTLKPKFRAFQEMGFSESELIQLVSTNPMALHVRDLRPKIEFWRSLLGTNENLLKAFRRDHSLLASSLAKKVMPNISLLRQCGIHDRRIAKMVIKIPWIVGRNPNLCDAIIRRAEELGVPRGSGMFSYVLQFVFGMSKSTFNAKFKLLKSLGWSEVEIMSAFRKNPMFLNLSEKNIRLKMDFFVKEARCELSYLVCRPVLLCFSLERRLIPRHAVLSVLKREGLLPGGECNLLSAFTFNDKRFLEKYVLRHEEKVPGLYEAYVAHFAGKVPNFQSK